MTKPIPNVSTDAIPAEQLEKLKNIAYDWMDNARAGLEADQLDVMLCSLRHAGAHGAYEAVIFGDAGAAFIAINLMMRKLVETAGSFEKLKDAAEDYLDRKKAQSSDDDA